jgi:hypothetical protein
MAFGNALGNSIVGAIQTSSLKRQLEKEQAYLDSGRLGLSDDAEAARRIAANKALRARLEEGAGGQASLSAYENSLGLNAGERVDVVTPQEFGIASFYGGLPVEALSSSNPYDIPRSLGSPGTASLSREKGVFDKLSYYFKYELRSIASGDQQPGNTFESVVRAGTVAAKTITESVFGDLTAIVNDPETAFDNTVSLTDDLSGTFFEGLGFGFINTGATARMQARVDAVSASFSGMVDELSLAFNTGDSELAAKSLASLYLVGREVISRPGQKGSFDNFDPYVQNSPTSYGVSLDVPSNNFSVFPLKLDNTGGIKTWQSPAGLIYGPDPSPNFGNRIQHVLNHAVDLPNRPGKHGVFDGRKEALQLTDEAWKKVLNGDSSIIHTANPARGRAPARDVYLVPMNQRTGYVGGQWGNANGLPEATHLRLVIENGNNVVSSFPVIP